VQVLLTGASGAIGAALAPRLAAAGHSVRAYARDPARVTAPGIDEVVRGDALTGSGIERALAGADVAYYLIHSMETAGAGAGDFAARERTAVERFARAARVAGLRRVVYLGGLVPDGARPSPHLASRLAVEEALLESAPEAVALRASIVIGATSRSFRFLVRLVERVPVMPLPAWRLRRTRPVDVRDVLALLLAAGTSDAVTGRLSLDTAGPDTVTYEQLIDHIRDELLVARTALRLPFSLTPVASVVAAAIAGEDPALIGPLMEGLEEDLLPRDDRVWELFGVRPHPLQAAIAHALAQWEASEELRAR
jgi:uncharacterized protein YbjT (DUF2867 family)